MRRSHSKDSILCLMCGVVQPFLRKMWWFLQSYTNSENVSVGPYGEIYPTSHDADQAVKVKAETTSDAEEEDDPVPITFSELKAESEVSCVFTLRQITQMCRSATCLSHLHLCLCTWNSSTVLLTGFWRVSFCSLLILACDVPPLFF
jgi:hypothetical protein